MASLHPSLIMDGDDWLWRVLSRRGLEARQRELAVLPVLADQKAWPQRGHAAGARCGAVLRRSHEPWALVCLGFRSNECDCSEAC